MRIVQVLLATGISGALLWLLFRNLDWSASWGVLDRMHWGWFIAANIPSWLVMLIRVFRWREIVHAAAPTRLVDIFYATQIGMFANIVLPARAGELVRPLALSRLDPRITPEQAVGLAAVDRLTDMVALCVAALVSAAAFTPSADVVIPAATFGTGVDLRLPADQLIAVARSSAVVLLAVLTLLVALVLKRSWTLRAIDWSFGLLSRRLAAWVGERAERFTDGLAAIRSLRRILLATALSLALWGSFVVSNACYFWAFGASVPWYMPFVMQAMLMAAISVPGMPGFVGQFHLPIVFVMVMVGFVPDEAKALAILFHGMNMVPVVSLGVFCLATTDLSIRELLRRQAAIQADGEDAPAG